MEKEKAFFTQAWDTMQQQFLANPLGGLVIIAFFIILLLLGLMLAGYMSKGKEETLSQGVQTVVKYVTIFIIVFIILTCFTKSLWLSFIYFVAYGITAFIFVGILYIFKYFFPNWIK